MKIAPIYAAALLIALPAAAGDLRTMMQQPGEWEATISGSMMPTSTQKGCYAGDKTVTDLTTKSFKNCSQKSVNIGAGTATVDAVCQLQGLQVTVHGTITPVGDDAIHSESQVGIQGMPPIKGIPGATPATMDAKRVGPCQPGEEPM